MAHVSPRQNGAVRLAWLPLAGVLIALPPGTASQPPPEPVAGLGDPAAPLAGNPGYDVTSYDWQLDVDPASASLRAHATMVATATSAAEVITLDYSGGPLDWVRVDGADVEHSYADPKLVIETATVEGESFSVEVGYTGTPEPALGRLGSYGWIARGGIIRNEGVLPGDMAAILPLNDTPLDPATWALTVTVPEPYVATASGELSDRVDANGSSTFTWRVEVPVSEMKFAIGEFTTAPIDVPPSIGVDVTVASPADSPIEVDSMTSLATILPFLVERLGPFPFEQLGFTMIDGLTAAGDSSPGQIHLAFVTDIQLVHEVAHQWMGGSVGTATSRDTWLREGLPRYLELVWRDEQGTNDLDSLVAEIREMLGGETRPPLEVTSPVHRVDPVPYDRGALALHALRGEVGDEMFWAIWPEFFAQFAGQSASTEDFIAVAEAVTGADLERFFDAWLRERAVPPP